MQIKNVESILLALVVFAFRSVLRELKALLHKILDKTYLFWRNWPSFETLRWIFHKREDGRRGWRGTEQWNNRASGIFALAVHVRALIDAACPSPGTGWSAPVTHQAHQLKCENSSPPSRCQMVSPSLPVMTLWHRVIANLFGIFSAGLFVYLFCFQVTF